MIHALLRAMPFRVVTLALGVVDSAAAVVFSAGQQRIASPNTRFLLHPSLTTPSRDMTLDQLAEVHRLTTSRTDEEFAAIASVMRGTASRLRETFERGWVLSAFEARRVGFVTRIAREVAYEERILKGPDSGSTASELLRI